MALLPPIHQLPDTGLDEGGEAWKTWAGPPRCSVLWERPRGGPEGRAGFSRREAISLEPGSYAEGPGGGVRQGAAVSADGQGLPASLHTQGAAEVGCSQHGRGGDSGEVTT